MSTSEHRKHLALSRCLITRGGGGREDYGARVAGMLWGAWVWPIPGTLPIRTCSGSAKGP